MRPGCLVKGGESFQCKIFDSKERVIPDLVIAIYLMNMPSRARADVKTF